MNLNELLVKQLQSKERELAAIKEKRMQEVVITQEQKQQAELLAQIAVEKYKQEVVKEEPTGTKKIAKEEAIKE